jgi:putative DNA primase/helicase
LLREKIIEIGNVVLILIDPISAYLGHGRLDTFRTSDVRAVLAPLVDLAAEQKTAIIGILHFNKKVDVTNALLRISDSLAFGATARHVYATVDDREHERKLLVRGKNNLSCRADKALAYRFAVCCVGTDPETGKEIWAPHIVWDNQYVDVTASEAMQAAAEARAPAARDDAKKFLAELLAAGPVPKAEIEEAADANGIAERTLRRAKNELGIVAKKDGQDGCWRWHMPEPIIPARRWEKE